VIIKKVCEHVLTLSYGLLRSLTVSFTFPVSAHLLSLLPSSLFFFRFLISRTHDTSALSLLPLSLAPPPPLLDHRLSHSVAHSYFRLSFVSLVCRLLLSTFSLSLAHQTCFVIIFCLSLCNLRHTLSLSLSLLFCSCFAPPTHRSAHHAPARTVRGTCSLFRLI
jgi:hypothetical protein